MSDPFNQKEKFAKNLKKKIEALKPEDDANEMLRKRKRKLRRSREAFQSRAATLGPIQLQAPGLGGL